MSLDEITQYSVAQDISLGVDALERKMGGINPKQKDLIKLVTGFLKSYITDFTYVVSQDTFSEIGQIQDDNLDGQISGIFLQLKGLFLKRELRKDIPQNGKPPFHIQKQTIFQTREELRAEEDALIKELESFEVLSRLESLTSQTDDVADVVAQIL